MMMKNDHSKTQQRHCQSVHPRRTSVELLIIHFLIPPSSISSVFLLIIACIRSNSSFPHIELEQTHNEYYGRFERTSCIILVDT